MDLLDANLKRQKENNDDDTMGVSDTVMLCALRAISFIMVWTSFYASVGTLEATLKTCTVGQ